ncbi:MAG: caspase family protein [Deltaproteobacteria bacterium]|nr:caspase family protein [Deltaproteobacteria bacterium]
MYADLVEVSGLRRTTGNCYFDAMSINVTDYGSLAGQYRIGDRYNVDIGSENTCKYILFSSYENAIAFANAIYLLKNTPLQVKKSFFQALKQRDNMITIAQPAIKPAVPVSVQPTQKSAPRAWLGVSIQDLTPEIAQNMPSLEGLGKIQGVLVADVVKDGPAGQAGILPGDIIIQFNSTYINKTSELTALVSAAKDGKAVLMVLRDGKRFFVAAKLAIMPVEIAKKIEIEQATPASPHEIASLPSLGSSTIKSDVDELPAIKVKPNKNAYAIVIGIETYRQKLPKADFATADAKTMAEYLTKVMGYPEENVVTLANDRAALGDFVKYFEKWLPNNVEKDSTVFIYYSGHGAPNIKNGDAYLVPYDGDPTFITETGYPIARLYESLGKLKAKEITVVLDSCFSGGGSRSVLAKGARPLVMNLQDNMVLSKNMTVLSASSGDQISSTYDEKSHGLFTYFLLKGIKNEDVIKQDGSIKMDDLFGYIKPQVEHIARKQFNNEQTPQLIGAKKN